MRNNSMAMSRDANYGNVITDIRDYRPSSFQNGNWEVVTVSDDGPDFAPLKLNVIEAENSEPDLLFAVFDRGKNDSDTRWHSGNPNYVPPRKKEVQAAVIDEKVIEEVGNKKYAEGHSAGIEEGRQSAIEEAEIRIKALESRFNELSNSVESQLKVFFEKVEKEAVKLSLEVAKKILSATVEMKPDYILEVMRAGLGSLGAATPIRIRVSHEDLEFLEIVGTPTDLSPEELGVKYVGDESIKSGCVIETDFGEVDVQLDAMWDKIKDELAEVYK